LIQIGLAAFGGGFPNFEDDTRAVWGNAEGIVERLRHWNRGKNGVKEKK